MNFNLRLKFGFFSHCHLCFCIKYLKYRTIFPFIHSTGKFEKRFKEEQIQLLSICVTTSCRIYFMTTWKTTGRAGN